VRYIMPRAREEIIDAQNVMPSVEESFAKMRTQKSRTPRHKYALSNAHLSILDRGQGAPDSAWRLCNKSRRTHAMISACFPMPSPRVGIRAVRCLRRSTRAEGQAGYRTAQSCALHNLADPSGFGKHRLTRASSVVKCHGLGAMFASMVSPSGDFFFQGLLVRDAAAEAIGWTERRVRFLPCRASFHVWACSAIRRKPQNRCEIRRRT
jgi:hypothetical protein